MEDTGIVLMRGIGIAQLAMVALGLTWKVRHLFFSICLLITGLSQGRVDVSLMPKCTGIGEVGRETGIGSTITGEGLKTKGTTD
jgi:hypothetical protein